MKQNKEQDTDKYACYSSLNVCFLLRHRKKVPATNLHAVNSDRFERPQWLTVPEVYHSSIPQRVALLIKSSSPWKGHWRFHVTHLRYAGAGPLHPVWPCDLDTSQTANGVKRVCRPHSTCLSTLLVRHSTRQARAGSPQFSLLRKGLILPGCVCFRV